MSYLMAAPSSFARKNDHCLLLLIIKLHRPRHVCNFRESQPIDKVYNPPPTSSPD